MIDIAQSLKALKEHLDNISEEEFKELYDSVQCCSGECKCQTIDNFLETGTLYDWRTRELDTKKKPPLSAAIFTYTLCNYLARTNSQRNKLTTF